MILFLLFPPDADVSAMPPIWLFFLHATPKACDLRVPPRCVCLHCSPPDACLSTVPPRCLCVQHRTRVVWGMNVALRGLRLIKDKKTCVYPLLPPCLTRFPHPFKPLDGSPPLPLLARISPYSDHHTTHST